MNKKLNAPCGLYCGVCGVYLASSRNDVEMKEKFAKAYNVNPEEISCKGCLSDERFVFCQFCGIRNCVNEKSIEGCHLCEDFPCRQIDEFPVPVGKKEILRSVPERKKLGDRKWVESEELRYICLNCKSRFFRGKKRCSNCKQLIMID